MHNLKRAFKEIEVENEIVKEVIKDTFKKVVETKLDKELRSKLQDYRTSMANLENVKAYLIYSNNTLEEIIKAKPKNKEELMKVKGFGAVKVEKYGASIVEIIRNQKIILKS